MTKLNLEKLDRSYFNNDEQYKRYETAHNVNNNDRDDDELGNSYVTAIWNLVNLFIKEKKCTSDIVKKSPDYAEFSGFQVEFAQSYYNQLIGISENT